MKDEDWKCCDCSKSKAHKHEELWSFSHYGNNQKTINDSIKGNQRCEKHFLEAEKLFNK